jgi:hypothetical protein
MSSRIATALCLALIACSRASSSRSDRQQIWYVPAVELSNETVARLSPGEQLASLGALVAIDSASFRPVVVRPGGSGVLRGLLNDSAMLIAHATRAATITTYQSSRYHPETIRALANDTLVMAATARSLLGATRERIIIVDFQKATPDDLAAMVEMVRAIELTGRRIGRGPLAMVVPAGDTIGYPTRVLGQVARIILIRLHGEHRPGTAPGPLATPEFIAREIGMRSREIGASRLGVELPLFGYRWNRDGTAAIITYADAQSLVRSEAGTFTRDPPSQFLTATGRDGWTIWLPDAQTIRSMIAAVRRRGVNVIALAGVEGADPAILPQPDTPVRR